MTSPIWLTLVIAFVAVASSFRFSGRLFSPVSAYFGGWLFAMASLELCTWLELKPYYSLGAETLIVRAHVGAALGFVLGSLIFGRRPRRRLRRAAKADYVAREDFWLHIAYHLVAWGHLAWALHTYGASLFTIRQMRLVDPGRFAGLVNYFMTTGLVLVSMYGRDDGTTGRVRSGRLLSIIVALSVHHTALGMRIFIVLSALVYSYSFIVAMRTRKTQHINTTGVIRLAALCSVPLLVFPIMGALRSTAGEVTSATFGIKGLIALPAYVSDAMAAIGPHAAFAAEHPSTQGAFTADGIVSLPYKVLGVSYPEDDVFGIQYYRRLNIQDPVGWTQSSAIPMAIADLGVEAMPFAFFAACFIAQSVFIFWSEGDIFKNTVAVWMTVASTYSIQRFHWFSRETVTVLVGALLLQACVGRASRRVRGSPPIYANRHTMGRLDIYGAGAPTSGSGKPSC